MGTSTERVRAHRQRKAAEGLAEVRGVFAPLDEHDRIKRVIKESIVRLSPIVNVDVKMPKKMLNALNVHEAGCVVTGVKSVTVDAVRLFLRERYGEELAEQFRPEYLFTSKDQDCPDS